MGLVTYSRHGAVACVTIDHPPVNALGHAVRLGLIEAVAQAEADAGVMAVVLVGAGRGFIAGADIKEFGQPVRAPNLPDVIARIDACPLLVVAVIHGVALGGGLEVALAADARIATPSARVGLPEVGLGLIPGAGGTQRLPRLIGADAAIGMITGGRPIGAVEALELGLFDRLGEDPAWDMGLAYATEVLEGGVEKRRVSAMVSPKALDWDAVRVAVQAKARGQRAPLCAVDAVQASTTLPFEAGLAEERRIFLELMQSDQRQALIHAFFAERAVSALPELEGVAPRALGRIGVVGGGTMGAGIATAHLLAGLPVTLIEASAAAAQTARDRIEQNLDGALLRGKITKDARDRCLDPLLVTTTDYDALAQADLVIEAVYEDAEVKKSVFRLLDASCKPGAVLASNTSYLDLRAFAAVTNRPQDVIGLHFFSPAHVMKLVEVVAPENAGRDAVATGFALAKRLGKTAVLAGICDGFIGNRLLHKTRTVADHMVLDGASPAEIDAALVDFGFAMGPYAVADMAGLDIGWANRRRLKEQGMVRGRAAHFPDRLCEAGQFGQKSGRGYYDYTQDSRAREENPVVLALIAEERKDRGITPQRATPDQIVRKYMAAMVNEAACVLEEGIARRPLDIDVVLMAGYGFPRFHGGPCKWADLTGLPSILTDIESYAFQDPEFWRPAPLLQRLVAEGRVFEDLNT